jgi:serine protease Do
MYDNFNNNNQNNRNAQFPANSQGGTGRQDAFLTPKPITISSQPKHRKGKLRNVIALGLAVLVLGGGAGFGGATLANLNNDRKLTSDSENNAPAAPAETTVAPDLSSIGALPANTPAETEAMALPANATAEMNYTQLFTQVKDAVVAISITVESSTGGSAFGFGGYGERSTVEDAGIVGSGVIFTEDGYILTNHHVITDAVDVSVVVGDPDDPDASETYPAEVIGADASTDLAVLKIDSGSNKLSAVPFGNSSDLQPGQAIGVVGNPLGLAKTITQGIVSGINRMVGDGGYELHSIQIDAAVNPGNSGGPLFDMYGNVVGIVNQKLVYENVTEGLGFAISIDEAKPIISDLIENGEVTSRPVLGITTRELNEAFAAALGLDITSGLLINGVDRGAPAYGVLAMGDIIVKVNGSPVATVTDVQNLTLGMQAGDTITVTVVRQDQFGRSREVDLQVELTNSQSLTGEYR